MTPAEIAALRALADAATPGPWWIERLSDDPMDTATMEPNVIWLGVVGLGGDVDHADAAFIAAARTSVPALLDEVERLRGALRGVLSAMPKQMATVADADRLRPHINNARRVLGEDGKGER